MLDLGRYKLTKLIATGGMAKVYNAVDSKGEFKNIAAKVPLDFVLAQPQYLKRFQNEAKISLKFKHPNIMRMFDAGTHEGMPYMIMEFIDGMALEDLQEKKKIFTIKEAIPLILDLLDAIKHMHNYRDEDISSSIVHRDLSPQNVIIRNDGRVVLMDFGIAKTKSLTSVTMGTATIGKPYYMAPEQVQSKDSSNIDKRADIYAVGVMLYEMLTGKKPFEGSNPFQVMEKVRNPKFTARPPHELNPDIPKGISEIIMRTMHKNREQRFQSAEELMAALKKGRDTSEAKKINQIIACMVTLAVLMIATGITGLVFSVKTRNKELAAIPLEICPHGVTNKNSISLSGWSLPDNKIRIYNRDRYDEKILSSQGYFKFDNIQLNPGENVLRPVLMSMDDQVISRGSTFCHIIYDIIPPDKPKILTETKITPKREISIRGITEPHSSVMVTFASNESKLFGPFKDGTFEISGLTLAQGPNTFKTAGIDAAGNTSEITIFNIHSDTVIPDAPVFPSKSMYVNENNTIISGRAEAFSKIAVQYKKTVHNVQTGAQGVFHADLKNILADFSVLQEKGFAEVTFKTIDRAGNISKNPVTLNINYLPFDSFSLQAIPFYTNNDVLKLKLKGPSGKSITINYNSNSISDTLISDDYSEFPLGLHPGINNLD
jgi:serine/threonine protein kinase